MSDKLAPYKVVVFGAGGVGKSSIVLRFTTDTFTSEYLPTIEDCYRKNFMVDKQTAFLDILDTAGQEEYSALRDQWVREGKAFILVYSVILKASFDDLSNFRERILEINEEHSDLVPIVLVANKCDLESQREVSKVQGEELAKRWGIPYLETSALKGDGVTAVFEEAVREARKFEVKKATQSKANQSKPKKKWCTIL